MQVENCKHCFSFYFIYSGALGGECDDLVEREFCEVCISSGMLRFLYFRCTCLI
jgi:hypothetical protein